MKKKRTFFRNMLAIMIRSYRWRMNPKNIEAIITLEQQLWKLGFVCFFTYFVLSCAPVKKLEKTENKLSVETATEVQKKTEVVTDTKVTDKTEKVTDKTIELIEKEWNDLEIRITAYDTNKPIDSITRKPPVMRETVITKANKKDKVTKNVDKSTTQNNLTGKLSTSLISEVDSTQRVKSKLQSETESKEVPIWVKLFSWIVGIILIAVFIWAWTTGKLRL